MTALCTCPHARTDTPLSHIPLHPTRVARVLMHACTRARPWPGLASVQVSSSLASLILFNAAVFALAVYVKAPAAVGMALYNGGGAWWQVGARTYCCLPTCTQVDGCPPVQV